MFHLQVFNTFCQNSSNFHHHKLINRKGPHNIFDQVHTKKKKQLNTSLNYLNNLKIDGSNLKRNWKKSIEIGNHQKKTCGSFLIYLFFVLLHIVTQTHLANNLKVLSYWLSLSLSLTHCHIFARSIKEAVSFQIKWTHNHNHHHHHASSFFLFHFLPTFHNVIDKPLFTGNNTILDQRPTATSRHVAE